MARELVDLDAVEILVLDEPTSHLDPRGKWDLVELLRHLPLTKIIASHDLEMVRSLCERAVVIDQGQVVADEFTIRILEDITLLRSHGLAADEVRYTPIN